MPLLASQGPLLAAVTFLYVGAMLGLRLPRQAPGWRFLLLVPLILILIPFAVTARGFGRVDMVAFFFHAQFGIDNDSILPLVEEIVMVAVALAILVLATLGLLALLRPKGRWAESLVLAAVAAVLVGINPLSAFAMQRVLYPAPDLGLETMLVTPVPVRSPDPLPDLVYVYLEGLDRRFIDPEVGGDSYAAINGLAAEGLSLLGIGQVTGTGWSLGGMVASQCGVPLLPKGLLDTDSLEVVTDFLPALTCLTDILQSEGYTMEFLVGGHETFAGIDAFYASHGVHEIFGKARVMGLFPRDEVAQADVGWVVDDQMIYDAAQLRFAALSAEPAPLALFIETFGPHGDTGAVSRDCTKDGKAAKTDDHIHQVRCLAELTRDFVADLRAAHAASGRQNDLRIVVQSDHLNHGRFWLPVAPELDTNTVILLGGPEVGAVNTTPGSAVDLYPTLLDWLGFGVTSAGLGHSLLDENAPPTLVERYGLEMLDRALQGATALADQIWRKPG